MSVEASRVRTLARSAGDRVAAIDWDAAYAALDAGGYAVLPRLLDADECAATAALYDDPALFRKRVVMARHGYGRGEYQYFAYPLPPLVEALRSALYRCAAHATSTR